jgi:hypothetical protein
MDTTIARLIDDAAQAAGLNDYQLSAAIGLLPGNRVISPKQVRRMRDGEQKHFDLVLLRRLAEVLPTLDEDEAWLAALDSAGLRPEGLTVDMLRRTRYPAAMSSGGRVAKAPISVVSTFDEVAERRRRRRSRRWLEPAA